MPKTKRFIEKKKSTTFVLAHRSQRDPLIADETAPQNILVPLHEIPSLQAGGSKDDKEGKKEEQVKYGIYFDDDYDYLQHLRDSKEVSDAQWDYCERIYAPSDNHPTIPPSQSKDMKLKFPSSVFESEFKEDIGLLNKAAESRGPRPDLDPDIMAALDDDFDFEDPEAALEDNFIELANEGVGAGPEDGLSEEEDSVGSLRGGEYSDDEEEAQTRFTNYSMSSSVLRRNKNLILVDDCFEKMFEGYDDTEIGALDCDEIEGDMDPASDLLIKCAEEFEVERKAEKLLNQKISNLALTLDHSDSNEEEGDEGEEEERDKWDCQSILSTYSNTKNRPKILAEPSNRSVIKVGGKTGIPLGVLGKGLTKQSLKVLDEQYAQDNKLTTTKSTMTGATSIRNKDESPEERRERKMLVKEYRRERRIERKANTDAFKDEKKRLEKVRLNDRHNVQGLKL